jgi:hypothetical protein
MAVSQGARSVSENVAVDILPPGKGGESAVISRFLSALPIVKPLAPGWKPRLYASQDD